MNPGVTTSIILETRTKKKDNSHSVKLRVTYQRNQRYYKTGISLSKEDFSEALKSNPRKKYRKVAKDLMSFETRALDIIESLDFFSFPLFESHFLAPKKDSKNVFDFYDEYHKELTSKGRLNSAETYLYSKKSLIDYKGKERISFDEVDQRFLEDYESWMIEMGKSVTTIGIYLRCLRTIYNLAINAGLVKQEQYPFGRHKYQIPKGRNIKKALTIEDIGKIYNHPVMGKTERFAKDMWMLSYFCNGINIKDIAYLRYKNLDGDTLKYVRSKTERSTKKDQREIVVYLPEQARKIIDQWKNDFITNETYLFPILHKGITPKEEWRRVRQTVQTINKYMGRIGKELKIEKPITTYTARHSYSTILKRAGVSTEFISESLGHHDLRTTENYLDSFEDDVKKKYSEYLTRF